MSSITVNFLNQISRFSILYALSAPIYIFSTGEYKDPVKLSLAILILLVIVTTLNYWKDDPAKKTNWMIADRLIAVSIVIVTFIYGNSDTKAFLGAAVYFYLLGYSGKFKNYNSFINHIVFRFFAGTAILMYIVDNETLNPIFLVFNLLIVLGLIFVNVNKVQHNRCYNKKEQITDSILIF